MFVFSNTLAIERVWVYFFSIFEETFDAVYGSYYNYYYKAIRQKKSKMQEQNLFEVSQKSPFPIMLFDFVLG